MKLLTETWGSVKYYFMESFVNLSPEVKLFAAAINSAPLLEPKSRVLQQL